MQSGCHFSTFLLAWPGCCSSFAGMAVGPGGSGFSAGRIIYTYAHVHVKYHQVMSDFILLILFLMPDMRLQSWIAAEENERLALGS